MLSFTETVIQGSQKSRKVGPFGACSTSHSRSPPLSSVLQGWQAGESELSTVCSPPPKSMVPCLPSALEGVVSVLARNGSTVPTSTAVQRVDKEFFVYSSVSFVFAFTGSRSFGK